MKKTIIATVLALLTVFETSNSVSAQTIYTSLPDPEDKYYQPFKDSLKYFNQSLQRNAVSEDKFFTLADQEENFKTKNFYYPDIWLRDVAPVVTTRLVKFQYAPNYLKPKDSHYLNGRFNKFLKSRYRYSKSSLILDGGNLQWNGDQTVILTNQVYHDNPDWSKQEIVEELQDKLNIKHVIIISKEPGDVLGHSDGMVKFISSHKLFINDFSYEPGFLKQIEHQIRKQDPEMKFVVLPSAYTSKGQYDKKIASAKGLYINMLETKQAIYFPMYGLKSDKKVMQLVAAQTNKKIIPINVGKISTLGGSIHCLTFDVPDRFAK